MAGIYIHIPFCKKACNYCNFHFSTSTGLQKDFVAALLKEIQLQQGYLSDEISTIYFGGGTPSVLPTEDIAAIIAQLSSTFTIATTAEITLEANPDDISSSKLSSWKESGINRLSIGIQSFLEEDLQWMNRAHSATQAVQAIELAQAHGFHNLTIDLIYGTPTLSDEQWQANVEKAVALQIPHISCYALTVEPQTALDTLIRKKKLQAVDPDKQARHFELLVKWLSEAGYEHYEISNFAKPGYRSRHNSSYWKGKHYLGLGPSAHSFNGISRQWNIANNALYIQSLKNEVLNYEIEQLTKEQQLNEYIMTSLRTIEGLSLKKVEVDFGESYKESILKSSNEHLRNNNLALENDTLFVTPKGKFLSDGIAADLFVD